MEGDKFFLQKKMDRGIKFFNSNQLDKAIECFRYLENNNKTKKAALLYLGVIEIKKQNNNNAKKHLNKVIEIDFNNELANLNLGLLSFQEKKFSETKTYLNKVLTVNTENTVAKYHLGLINLLNKEFEAAEEIFGQILKIEPKNISVLNNLGIIYLKQQKFDEAINVFKNCLNLNKSHKFSILNLGNAYFHVKDFENAIVKYNKILSLDKNHTMAKIGLSKCYFAKHDYKKGFKFFEARKNLQVKNPKLIQKINTKFETKEWFGQNLDNKTILILSEQGIGDNIQFARYIFLLKEKFNTDIFFCIEKRISHLFKDCPCKIISDPTELEKIDFYQHLLTLPYIFFEKENNFQKSIPFIKINRNNEIHWIKRLDKLKKPLIVLQWKGNKNYISDQLRSLPLKFFDKLIKNKNFSFLSLQKDNSPSEIQENNLQNFITDLSGEIDMGDKSFEDTISILNNVDLLIGVDTSMVHLAATLGIETLLILNANPDWRWHIQSKNKCFYEKLKIIQSKNLNDWSNITELIDQELNHRFKL